MTERINGQGFRPLDTSGARRAEGSKAAADKVSNKAPEPSAPQSGDTVSLTRSAVLLGKLEELVRNVPSVDAERVRAIKEAVSSGSYEIDDQAVADNMIRMDRELIG
jgi:negative regulator of flagellin synthesis FlgM